MTPRITDIRDALFAGLAAIAGAWLAPGLAFVGVPLGALATGWLTYRFGARAGVVAGSLAAIVASVAGSSGAGEALSSSVFILPAMIAAGPLTVWALKRWKVTSVVAALTAVLFVALVAGVSVQSALAHTTVTAQTAKEAEALVAAYVRGAAAQNPSLAATLKASAAQIAGQVAMLWPAGLFLSVALSAAIAVPAVSLLGRRMGMAVAVLPALADLDLSFHLVWPAIAGLALLAVDAFLSGGPGWSWAAGMNLLIVVRPALFIQGLAVFAALYRRLGVGRFGRNLGYVLLGLSEMAVPSVSIVGVADLFFNLRRLPRDGSGALPGRQ